MTFMFLAFLRGPMVTWHDLLNFYVTGLKQNQTFEIVGRLNFKCLNGYLNFNILFMKNMSVI